MSVWISAGYLAFSDGPGFVFCCLGTPSNRRLWILVITLLGFIPTYDNHIWWRTFYALPIWVNLLVWSEVLLFIEYGVQWIPSGREDMIVSTMFMCLVSGFIHVCITVKCTAIKILHSLLENSNKLWHKHDIPLDMYIRILIRIQVAPTMISHKWCQQDHDTII